MLIEVLRPETWDELNERIALVLNIKQGLRVRCYLGMCHAAYEVAVSTSQFLAHKKSIGIVLGNSFSFVQLLPLYYKENYDVQKIECIDLKDPLGWVEGLKKDTSYVLYAADNPITGEKFQFSDELDRLLNEKKIVSLRVSHIGHRYSSSEVRPYTIELRSYCAETAVAVMGDRIKTPPFIAQNYDWQKERFEMKLRQVLDSGSISKKEILDFEDSVRQIADPYFAKDADRIYDRAVILLKGISADAFVKRILGKLNVTATQGQELIQTTDLCYWNSSRIFSGWWNPIPSNDYIGKMVVISSELILMNDFASLAFSTYEEIANEQSWKV